MHFPRQLFKRAGLTPTDVANLVGVSRVTGWRWLMGTDRSGNGEAGVNIFLQERVLKIVPALEHAVAAGALPDAKVSAMAPLPRAVRLKSILRQHRVKQ